MADFVTATIHPSSILRRKGGDDRRAAMAQFVEDLRHVARALEPARR
jgi:uracil-DNA glycosylase